MGVGLNKIIRRHRDEEIAQRDIAPVRRSRRSGMSVSTGAPTATASAAPAAALASAVGDSLVGGAVRSATSAGVSTFLGSALPVGDSVGVRFGVARVRGREDGGL
ncbi:hypothetical protein INT45_013351 [Circinella minor]|uniref:Uncharacterized protein n=1 Tax=Circinella minor TaxID=1195481 RepID=A0A8H7RXZ4_9FUNG|nr:hypothetical protein INT45_013351 [Circinella minor]